MYKRDKQRLKVQQMNTLIGINKGVIADSVVNQKEAEFILEWLSVHESLVLDNSEIDRLYERVSRVLEDGFLDKKEAAEVLTELKAFAGERSEMGELLKSSLPVYNPQPPVVFEGKVFKFTGRYWVMRAGLFCLRIRFILVENILSKRLNTGRNMADLPLSARPIL